MGGALFGVDRVVSKDRHSNPKPDRSEDYPDTHLDRLMPDQSPVGAVRNRGIGDHSAVEKDNMNEVSQNVEPEADGGQQCDPLTSIEISHSRSLSD